MNVRLGIVVLATGALALGMLAPGAVNATPPSTTSSAEKPSGKAMVNIDGGTGYAERKSKGVYRVAIPEGAEINWMGDVEGKGTRVGTFRPKAFVAAWERMGHRDGSRASTTVTWKNAGDKVETFRQVTVDAPRINAKGQITFVVTTIGKLALPAKMQNFSLNIGIASGPAPRAFTVFGPDIYFDSTKTAYVYANATDVSTGWVYFALNTDSNLCKQGGYPLVGTSTVKITAPIPCGNFTVNPMMRDGKTQSTVSLVPPSPTASSAAQGQISGAFSVTPAGQPSAIFDIKQVLMTYTKGGGAPTGSGSTAS